jgi:hypothetical protein
VSVNGGSLDPSFTVTVRARSRPTKWSNDERLSDHLECPSTAVLRGVFRLTPEQYDSVFAPLADRVGKS